ncbi:MAG TPA: hypothetical protein VLH41_09105 [Thermoanaerobaculia bacterium]|nr:hypothetical protein [Thermoanaerobaculia bacterium]
MVRPGVAAAGFLVFAWSAAARAEGPAPDQLLVAEVNGPGGARIGLLSLPRAGGPAASRLCFVSSDGRRLDAEVAATKERRTVRLISGNGSQLEVVQLWEFAPARQGIPTILLSGGERLLVTDPGPGGDVLQRNPAAVLEAVATWLSPRAPGLAALVREARALAEALSRPRVSPLTIPAGYAFNPAPLLGLEILAGPSAGELAGTELSVSVLPAKASGEVLARRPVWRRAARGAGPSRQLRARVVGGKEERLGELTGTREDAGAAIEATLGWGDEQSSSTLRLKLDGPGILRVKFDRTAQGRTGDVLSLETVAGGSGDLWLEPWIVETAKGHRRPLEIPSAPRAEAERAEQTFFDEVEAALRAAGLSEADGSRLLWRWYRLLDSERVRDFLPELSGLVDHLASMHAPPYGGGPQNAWAGAVRVE